MILAGTLRISLKKFTSSTCNPEKNEPTTNKMIKYMKNLKFSIDEIIY